MKSPLKVDELDYLNRNNWKILFVLNSYEYLERLEGKIRDGKYFLY